MIVKAMISLQSHGNNIHNCTQMTPLSGYALADTRLESEGQSTAWPDSKIESLDVASGTRTVLLESTPSFFLGHLTSVWYNDDKKVRFSFL